MKKVFKNNLEGKRSIGKPRKGRLDHVKNCVKKIGVMRSRKVARDRDASKLILKEAKVLRGPYSQWRLREE